MKQIAILAGSASSPLAAAIASSLDVSLCARELQRFPDGEIHVDIGETLRERDVYIVQSTSPPISEHLLELLLIADAAHRAGAARVTAVVPYFGYARSDRRVRGREAIGARLVCDLLERASIQRVVTVDAHQPTLEGFCTVPMEHLTALPLLVAALRSGIPSNAVVVAPDLGAAKLAQRVSELLDLPTALVHKVRLSGAAVRGVRVIGDVAGCTPIIVDDIISTGRTLEAAIGLLLAADAVPQVTVAATHGVFVGDAFEVLGRLPIERAIVTDSVAPWLDPRNRIEIVALGNLLASAVGRLHRGESLNELIAHA